MEGFVIYADSDTGPPVYSNVGVDYGVGMFEIVLEPEVLASSFIVQRPAGGYITICEFEAYEGKETDLNQCIINVKIILFSSFQTISYNIRLTGVWKMQQQLTVGDLVGLSWKAISFTILMDLCSVLSKSRVILDL